MVLMDIGTSKDQCRETIDAGNWGSPRGFVSGGLLLEEVDVLRSLRRVKDNRGLDNFRRITYSHIFVQTLKKTESLQQIS